MAARWSPLYSQNGSKFDNGACHPRVCDSLDDGMLPQMVSSEDHAIKAKNIRLTYAKLAALCKESQKSEALSENLSVSGSTKMPFSGNLAS
jgi:hypothetical protein